MRYKFKKKNKINGKMKIKCKIYTQNEMLIKVNKRYVFKNNS